jgi:hypothetical protein
MKKVPEFENTIEYIHAKATLRVCGARWLVMSQRKVCIGGMLGLVLAHVLALQ